jgi:uncharacterized protein (DUF1330 family)
MTNRRGIPRAGRHATRLLGYILSFSLESHGLSRVCCAGGPAIQAGGGHFLARDAAAQVFEGGLQQRVVIIEFDSVESALRTYQSSVYQTALDRLKGAAERDVRIIEGTL